MIAAMLLVSLASTAAPQADGLVRMRSARSMGATVAALDSLARARGLTVFTRVDHAANARGAGLELRPTTLFILGNPQVGTRLMQCAQTAAIDLPLRVLVWTDEAGQVWVGYEDPERLAARHGLGQCREPLERVKAGLAALVAAAAG